MKPASDIISRPILTEKASGLAEANKYVFEILPGADRAQVKTAIEASFKVTVQKVNILIRKGKLRREWLGRDKALLNGLLIHQEGLDIEGIGADLAIGETKAPAQERPKGHTPASAHQNGLTAHLFKTRETRFLMEHEALRVLLHDGANSHEGDIFAHIIQCLKARRHDHIHAPSQQINLRRRAAAIGDMQNIHARHLFEQFSGKMKRGARAGTGESIAPWVRARLADQFRHAIGREIQPGDQQIGQLPQPANIRKIARHIEG